MNCSYGENLHLTIFGQSHSAAIGMSLEGIPAGRSIDLAALNAFLARRAPGNSPLSTARKEADEPEFLGGLLEGRTCGAPIAAIIRNTDARSKDYSALQHTPRPGHADFTAALKYGGAQDFRGGGSFSGRMTAPLCIAGGICLQLLQQEGVAVTARITSVGAETDPDKFEPAILAAKEAGDSLGGVIECSVTGLPAGLGGPLFGGMESKLAAILYAIPAVKGVEFGDGFALAAMSGSAANDPFEVKNGAVTTAANRCGGILGGITTGAPLVFRCAFKPTPSIGLPQATVDTRTMTPATLAVSGRHDPCIVPRALPVVEAAAALAVYDALLGRKKEL